MQQHAATRPPTSGTGPGAEATTPMAQTYVNAVADCRAVITLEVTHNTVAIMATLAMGVRQSATQRWERRRGAGKGWVLTAGPRRWADEDERLGVELAEYLAGLDFPFALANMLPRRPTAAAIDAIAAAQEVSHV